MGKKLTITDILAQKEAAKKKKLARETVHIKAQDKDIVIEEPTKDLIMEATQIGEDDPSQGDVHLVYHCIVDPNLKENHKELMAHFGVSTPYEIVDCLFKPGEVAEIAQLAMKMAGYSGGNGVKVVRLVNDIKN